MTLVLRSTTLFLSLLLALAACSSRSDGRTGPGTQPEGGTTDGGTDGPVRPDVVVQPPADECDKMDILFVIDDSGSMQEEQSNLASNFPRFVEVINTFMTDGGSALDYRIGVTTTGKDFTTVISFPGVPLPPMEITETGPAGELLMPGQCNMSRRWLERNDPDVSGSFSCLGQVGTTGSSVEMPLHMLQLAITDRVTEGTNAGFLREDALLAVVILTDEDDCSQLNDRLELSLDPLNPAGGADICDPNSAEIIPIAEVMSDIDRVKGDRGRWATAVIAGPGPGACTSAFGEAAEATRLQDFVNQVGANGVFSSICEGDLTTALTDALNTFETACQNFTPLR
ncbi:MAG: hypothetical protein AAGF12_35925 [Myxococcota bacterium]